MGLWNKYRLTEGPVNPLPGQESLGIEPSTGNACGVCAHAREKGYEDEGWGSNPALGSWRGPEA